MELSKAFDKYTIIARIFPALLIILSCLFSIYATSPNLITSNLPSFLATIFISFGALYFVSNFCRTLGRKEEEKLIENWGGLPTTLILRHSYNTLTNLTKKRYHSFLERNVPHIGSFPSPDEETQNHNKADEIYSSSIDWLKEQRRDKEKYSLLHEENIQYGFRRNLLGVKIIGIYLCIASILLIFVNNIYSIKLDTISIEKIKSVIKNLTTFQYMALFFDIIFLLCWIFVVNKNWVKEAGFQYAKTLLKSIETS